MNDPPRFRLHLHDLSFFSCILTYTPSSNLYLFPSKYRPEFSFHGILHSTCSLYCPVDLFALFAPLSFWSPTNPRCTNTFLLQLPSFRLSTFTPAYLLVIFSLVLIRLRPFDILHYLDPTTPHHSSKPLLYFNVNSVYTIFIYSIFLPMDGITICSLP